METRNGNTAPDAIGARLALQAADNEERSTQSRPMPRWLEFLAAVLCFATAGVVLIGPENSIVSVISMSVLGLAALTVIVLLARHLWFPPGYRKVRIAWKVLGIAVISAVVATMIAFAVALSAGDAGGAVTATWLFIVGGLCLLPSLLDVAEKHWPKRNGRHGA